MSLELFLVVCFLVKHFICDFPLQAFPYMYTNKGTYGHWGGILHAGIHAYATYFLLVFTCNIELYEVILLAMVDGVVHYHIDWAKMNIGKHYNLKPTNSETFWVLLGLDQLLHYLTYISIILFVIS